MSVLLFPPPELAPLGPEAAAGCAWLTALAAVATAELVEDWTGRDARDQVAQRRPGGRPQDRRDPRRTRTTSRPARRVATVQGQAARASSSASA